MHLGLNMAATAVPIASEEAGGNVQAGSEDVVLYFGIIDILQVRQCCYIEPAQLVYHIGCCTLPTPHPPSEYRQCRQFTWFVLSADVDNMWSAYALHI